MKSINTSNYTICGDVIATCITAFRMARVVDLSVEVDSGWAVFGLDNFEISTILCSRAHMRARVWMRVCIRECVRECMSFITQ